MSCIQAQTIRAIFRAVAAAVPLAAACLGVASAQTPSSPEPAAWTTADDHRNMLDQLGIRALRPGPSGDEAAPNHANYDESQANPFPKLPDALTLRDGAKVTSADAWWSRRRAEIVEDFEREVVGRVPRDVPSVAWSVIETREWQVGDRRVVGRQLVGRVDNSAYPAIAVEICMTLVTPADAAAPVPVMIMFGNGALPARDDPATTAAPCRPPARPGARPGGPPPPADPPATDQLIAAGWGYVSLSPTSVQADNGAGLTRGIIGLVNRGQPRTPDDWGALRAWAWGASRGLDYLATQPGVDARRVGVEGVSRYGKAALVAMAFDTRFAVVLVGSSGEGGAKLHRRNFGEAVENLTGSGEYHWMAGNFLKYGAADATFGSMNAGDIPVDAHQLIALCAPRPTFISYGVPEKGDAKWLDQQGSFMAAVAAGPVFRLLGVKDLGTTDDYTTEKMPAVNVGLLDGALAWRQHDGGHTDGPNWKYFIPWADVQLGRRRD
jgi:(4-O-methyl)-D-glucuronate---lignin esterase